MEKRWSSHPSNVHCAREAVRDVLRALPRPADTDFVELAIGEACANAVEHGSPLGARNAFILRCFASQTSELIFEVEDEGFDFTPASLTLSGVPDLESEGGRGLFLIRQIMDGVSIQRVAGGLSVRMTKTVPGLLPLLPALFPAAVPRD